MPDEMSWEVTLASSASIVFDHVICPSCKKWTYYGNVLLWDFTCPECNKRYPSIIENREKIEENYRRLYSEK